MNATPLYHYTNLCNASSVIGHFVHDILLFSIIFFYFFIFSFLLEMKNDFAFSGSQRFGHFCVRLEKSVGSVTRSIIYL